MQLNINQIKTLYSTFKVIYQKKVMFNNKEVAGVCSHRRHLIKISTTQSIKSQIQSLEHEKLHAILEELKIDFDDEKEIDALSCTQVKFIQDNPEYIKVILEEGDKSAAGI
ncbi:MAG: hypothetical protein MUP69_10220 [Candidatus Atribacteria bacterium]|nr:hypothetical protein [Candidatus Atribacteria bacterium]